MLFKFAWILVSSGVVSAALTCLKCDSVVKPSACQFIDRCGPHEVCYIESFITSIGSIVYNLGCKDSGFCGKTRRNNAGLNGTDDAAMSDSTDVHICAECCAGDLCNAAGCGDAGFPPDLGPACFSCTSQIGANMCDKLEHCGRDQICEIHPLFVPGSSEDWYSTQCKHTAVCTAEQNAYSMKGAGHCNACCNTTLCNDYAPNHCDFTTVQTPPSTTTIKPAEASTRPQPSLHTYGNVGMCQPVIKSFALKNGNVLVQRGQSCYMMFHKQFSWPHAERTCVQSGGHLFQINNLQEQRYFQSILAQQYRHPVWLGLNDLHQEEHFQWSSGDALSYSNWMSNRKSDFNAHDNEDCVVFIPTMGGVWDDIACGVDNRNMEEVGQHHAFICQYPTMLAAVTHHPITSAPVSTAASITHSQVTSLHGNIAMCPQSTTFDSDAISQHGDYCYEISTFQTSWQRAESHCRTQHGYLLHISSAAENEYIYKLLRSRHHYSKIWLGLTDRHHEERFTWSSGPHSSYWNWKSDRLNSTSHDTEDCAIFVMDSQHRGQWDDVSCAGPVSPPDPHITYYGFICQYATVPVTPTSSLVHIGSHPPAAKFGNYGMCPSSIRDNLTNINGAIYGSRSYCYVLDYAHTTWSNAEHLCQTRYNGHLLDIRDISEQNRVGHFLKQYVNSSRVWIGLNDHLRMGHYKWTSGASGSFRYWHGNNDPPAVLHNHEGCVYMLPTDSGHWYPTSNCGNPSGSSPITSNYEMHPFVCKIAAPSSQTALIG